MHKTLYQLLLAIMLFGGACTPQNSTSPPPEIASASLASSDTQVRRAAVAGPFYPADADRLTRTVQGYLQQAEGEQISDDVIGLMAPHAGYEFCGAVAGYAYATIQGRSYDSVILIGPSHQGVPSTGAALSGKDAWETPLGRVAVDKELTKRLLAASDRFRINDFAHGPEHSLEVQLPFLQVVLDEFKIVPIVTADFSPQNSAAIAEAVASAVGDKKVLLVASTDMSHYPVQTEASRVDHAMLKVIAGFDPDEVYAADERLLGENVPNLHCTLCGLGPLVAVMKAAQKLGADQAHVLKYANSGDVAPALADRCGGYGAVVFVGKRTSVSSEPTAEASGEEDIELTQEQREWLLKLARGTIQQYVTSDKLTGIDTDDPAMHEQRAVFVTLTKQSRLRGCIGQIEAQMPLAEAIRDAAISAATRDPRFLPVTADELDKIHIEISVLSPLRQVDNASEIEVGKHGVLVRQGTRQGVFLPQVAPEQGWNREQMLTHLCAEKAGLPPDAWRKTATLYVFSCQVFGEEE